MNVVREFTRENTVLQSPESIFVGILSYYFGIYEKRGLKLWLVVDIYFAVRGSVIPTINCCGASAASGTAIHNQNFNES